jgi:cysteine protease ATG4
MAKPSTHPSNSNGPSKIPRFFQKQSRDRSKSMTDPDNNPTIAISPSNSEPIPTTTPKPPRKTHRKETPPPISPVNSMDEPPVIIEPVPVPRARTRSERAASDISPSSYSPTSTGNRIGDLPTRLSGWFSHTFSTSSTDLSLPSLLSQSSPKAKASSLLTAAKHGKGHLDKAVRYLLDSDATPDKCTEPIWLLGVQHPGYEPPPFVLMTRRSSIDSRRHSPSSFRSSSSSELSQSQPSNNNSTKHANPANNWPPVFYADFTSRIWLTYRSQFTPIRDLTLGALEGDDVGSSPPSKRTFWGGEKCWTTDAGWGCMLRTGQSLLANALLHLHLGRGAFFLDSTIFHLKRSLL